MIFGHDNQAHQGLHLCQVLIKLDVFVKNACLPPARSSVQAVEGRQRTRYDRFETEAFIKVRRTCTYIYMNICMVMIVSHLTLGRPLWL